MNIKFGFNFALFALLLTTLIVAGCDPTEPECDFQGVQKELFCSDGAYQFTNSQGVTLRYWTLTEHRWLSAVSQDTLPTQEEQTDLTNKFNNLFDLQYDYGKIAQLFPDYSGANLQIRPPVCPPTSSWENNGFDVVWDDANMDFVETKLIDVQGNTFPGEKIGDKIHYELEDPNNPPIAGDAQVYIKMKNLTTGVTSTIINIFDLKN